MGPRCRIGRPEVLGGVRAPRAPSLGVSDEIVRGQVRARAARGGTEKTGVAGREGIKALARLGAR
jgi:hypothetical protein